MNYPTLDYYLSGDYVIDRDLLIENINISNTSSDINYKGTFTTIIKSLSEDKLAILLKNWSGTTIVKKDTKYMISIIKSTNKQVINIYFGTCEVNIILTENILTDPKIDQIVIDIFTTPMNTMVDV